LATLLTAGYVNPQTGREQAGAHVAVVDADLTGPSMPSLLACDREVLHATADGWTPITVQDDDDDDENDTCTRSLSMVSSGVMLERRDESIVWRGAKKHGLLTKFLRDVEWPHPIQWLVVDTPPGTSDEHLTVCKWLRDSGLPGGAVVVTTPQEMSLQDVRKELAFLKKVRVPVLGVVENMTQYVCRKCGKSSQVFPQSKRATTQQMCEELGVRYLGTLPLEPRVQHDGHGGAPFPHFIDRHPHAPWSRAFVQIVDGIVGGDGE
jgi:Mrp family chromosome partitioning ATPase